VNAYKFLKAIRMKYLVANSIMKEISSSRVLRIIHVKFGERKDGIKIKID
jgi:hypothetical protein